MEGTNWLSIVVGALVPMVVGFIWYHPRVFGNAWMTSIGKTEEDLESGNMAVTMGVSYLLSAMLAYMLSMYVGFHDPAEQVFTHGAFHGGMLAVFVGVPVLATNSLFEQKNWTNIIINAVYWIITVALMGGVITFFF